MSIKCQPVQQAQQPGPLSRMARTCKVPRCTADLAAEQGHSWKHKVCNQHRYEAMVVLDGLNCRWCQGCTKFQDLDLCTGDNRRCDVCLQKLSKKRKVRASELLDKTASTKKRKPSTRSSARKARGNSAPSSDSNQSEPRAEQQAMQLNTADNLDGLMWPLTDLHTTPVHLPGSQHSCALANVELGTPRPYQVPLVTDSFTLPSVYGSYTWGSPSSVTQDFHSMAPPVDLYGSLALPATPAACSIVPLLHPSLDNAAGMVQPMHWMQQEHEQYQDTEQTSGSPATTCGDSPYNALCSPALDLPAGSDSDFAAELLLEEGLDDLFSDEPFFSMCHAAGSTTGDSIFS